MQKRIEDLERLIQKFLWAVIVGGEEREDVQELLNQCNLNPGQIATWRGYVDIAWFRVAYMKIRTDKSMQGKSNHLNSAPDHRAEDFGEIATHDALCNRQPKNPRVLPEDSCVPVPPDGY
eukprot:7125613-Karenia_brevis.AAC.1